MHVAGRIGSKKDNGTLEIFRLAPASGWNASEDLLAAERIISEGFSIVGCDVTRSDCVDIDSFGRPFVGKGHRQLSDSPL